MFLLGLTSMLTDISSEMVAAILPMYMIFALGFTPMQMGLVDGLYQGAAALARLAGGLLSDRLGRPRDVAAVGYGLSAACKLGLLAAGNAWGALSSVVALDRIGKGIRTSPRDALISLSCDPKRLGLAFGIHRALDTAGALLGPLVALAILASLPDAYDVVFVTSFCIAVVGLAVLLLFVRNIRPPDPPAAEKRPSMWAGARGLLLSRPYRTLLLCGTAMALVTVSDAFLYLLLQRRTSLAPSHFPLLFVATASTFLLLAVPAGKLGDRIGRARLFALGHVLLLLACVAAVNAGESTLSLILPLALLGAFYACTDGVLMAAASTLVPATMRASGLALLTTATGLARILASLMFGALWSFWGIEAAMTVFVIGLALVLLLTSRFWFRLLVNA